MAAVEAVGGVFLSADKLLEDGTMGHSEHVEVSSRFPPASAASPVTTTAADTTAI